MNRSTDESEKMISVTVIIPTYNRANYLPQALDSILAQTRAPDEILVIDDGSTDKTPDLLADYGSAIRVVRQANAGKPAALNKALKLATSSHIWIFDDDDVALPDALGGHVRFLESHSGVDFSYSDNFTFDGDGNIYDDKLWRRPLSPMSASPDTLLVELMRQCVLVFQGLLVPARCFEAVGYFDETLGRAEDYDMLLKLARRFRGEFAGHASFVWRNHEGERGSASERHTDAERNILFRKYERRIFVKVWQNYMLAEYLPGGSQYPARALSGADRIAAQITRCDVMFRHDLNHQATEDLNAVLGSQFLDSSTIGRIAEIVSRAANVSDAVFVPSAPTRARLLADAIRGPHRQRLHRAAMKGFYWATRRALRQRAWADVAKLVAAFSVFGVSSIRARRARS
jgi:glycosyltransferase involved in cell wall biosynthesis